MKDFLNYLLTIPQRIGIYFAKRRALREYRRAIEHARKMERLNKALELINVACQMGQLLTSAAIVIKDHYDKEKFPPRGIVTPGNSEGGEWVALPFDQWYRRRDGRVANEKEMRTEMEKEGKVAPQFPANEYREMWGRDQEAIRKAAEQWRTFDDKPKRDFSKNPLCHGREVYQTEIGIWAFCDTGEPLGKADVTQIIFHTT